jgi:hypothetical protein
MGWVLNGMNEDESTPVSTAAINTGTGGSSTEFGAALLDEIYTTLKDQYVDKELITPERLQMAAIDGFGARAPRRECRELSVSRRAFADR